MKYTKYRKYLEKTAREITGTEFWYEKTNWWDVLALVIVGGWVAYLVSRLIW